MNPQLLMKMQKMQRDMETMQKEIAATSFFASAGGVVDVEVKGTKEIVRVKVKDDFEVESKEDLDMLGEMVVAACNQAYKEIEKTIEEKMKKFNLPSGLGGLF